jgi:MFS family permease
MTPAHAAAPEPGETAVAPPLPAAVRLSFLAGPMLSMIDSSVVNVAVPGIAGGLHASLGTAAWAVSGYLLGLACGLAATPWLARRYGTLPAYGAALLAFTLASAACALVPSVALLIAARVVQGLAGAPMVPLAMSLILDPARAGDRTRGMPASAGVVLFAAPALGPAVGGLLISAFGWRSVFLVNLPIGLLALAGVRAARRVLAAGDPGTGRVTGDRGARLDITGLLLLAAGLGLATYGASRGPALGWLSAGAAPAWWARAGRRVRAARAHPGHRPTRPGAGESEPAPLAGAGLHAGAGVHRQRGPVRRAVPRPGVPAADPAPQHHGHRPGAAAPGDRDGPGELAGQRGYRTWHVATRCDHG